MNNKRLVYAKRGSEQKWTLIDFSDIAINEDFILCESDGTPVGHYWAMGVPSTDYHLVENIKAVEIT